MPEPQRVSIRAGAYRGPQAYPADWLPEVSVRTANGPSILRAGASEPDVLAANAEAYPASWLKAARMPAGEVTFS